MNLPTRPTVAEIDFQALDHNLAGIRNRVGPSVGIMAVVKANAYGHGAEQVSRFLQRKGVGYFGVAFPEEAVQLRKSGMKKPILVFALPNETQAPLLVDHTLEATISSVSDVELINRIATRRRRTVGAHVKVDTGMNRLGVKVRRLPEVVRALTKAKRVEVRGVYTHFANADEKDKTFARRQLAQFAEALDILRKEKVEAGFIHCANSAAIMDLPESYFSLVRPGISLYGYYSSHEVTRSIPLRPVMTLRSHVALVKEIEIGETVSYGRRYVAQRKTRIATVPIGYADGFSRLLTGKASVLIHGKRFYVAGTICMDQCMVDVGMEDVAAGDEVILIGEQNNVHITAQELADKIGTIPYEITCGIAARVPRTFKNL